MNSSKPPIYYLTFANLSSGAQPLPSLEEEKIGLENIFSEYINRYQSKYEPIRADPRHITDLIIKAEYDTTVVFHYAGHSNSDALEVFDQHVDVSKFGSHLKSIKLIFLNGCKTDRQARALLEQGVPVVIAASNKINDWHAKEFAVNFYTNLLSGDHSIQEAFDAAKAAYQSRNSTYHIRELQFKRDARPAGSTYEEELSGWTLFENQDKPDAKEWRPSYGINSKKSIKSNRIRRIQKLVILPLCLLSLATIIIFFRVQANRSLLYMIESKAASAEIERSKSMLGSIEIVYNSLTQFLLPFSTHSKTLFEEILDALQWERNSQPYVPQAEFALSQAVQNNLIRKVITIPMGEAEQVAFGENFIAVGGNQLRLLALPLPFPPTQNQVMANPSSIATPTVQTWAENEVGNLYWLRPDTLLTHSHTHAALWRNGREIASISLTTTVETNSLLPIPCIGWSPDTSQISICHQQELLLWQPDNGQMQSVPLPFVDKNEWIAHVSWSLDGKSLLVLTSHKTYLFDLALSTQQTFNMPLFGAVFLNSQEFFAYGYDGSLIRWSIDGKKQQTLLEANSSNEANVSNIVGIAFRQDRHSLLAYNDSGGVWLFDADGKQWTKREVALQGHNDNAIVDAAWQGDVIATAGHDGSIHFWDAQSGNLWLKLPEHQERVLRVHWLADQQHLASYGQDGTIRVWQILDEAGRPLCRFANNTDSIVDNPTTICRTLVVDERTETQGVESAHWINEREILYLTDDHTIKTWQVTASETRGFTQTERLLTEQFTFFNERGDKALLFESKGKGIVWRLNQPSTELTAPIEWAKWSGDTLLIQDESPQIRLYDAETQQTGTIKLPAPFSSRHWDGDKGEKMAVLGEGTQLYLTDLTKNERNLSTYKPVILAVSDFVGIEFVLLNPSETLIVVVESETGNLQLWNTQTLTAVARFTPSDAAGMNVIRPLFHPTADLFAYAVDGQIYLVSIESLLAQQQLSQPSNATHDGIVLGLRWNGAGDRLLSWSADGSARVWSWDATTNVLTEVLRLQPEDIETQHQIVDASFNHDESRILTVDTASHITVWQSWQDVEGLLQIVESCCRKQVVEFALQ